MSLAHSFARFAIFLSDCYLSYHLQTHCHVIQVEIPQTPCPGQCLQMLTTADNEHFDETSTACFGTPSTTVVINATGLPAGEQYHSNFSIKDHNGAVVDTGEESVLFSKSIN